MKFNEKQKRKVEERGYIYIGTYERNEKLLDGRILGVDVDREYKKSYVKNFYGFLQFSAKSLYKIKL